MQRLRRRRVALLRRAGVNTRDWAAEIDRALWAAGTPATAAGAKTYLKSDLAFYGVTVPEVRRIIREAARPRTRQELVALVDELWSEPRSAPNHDRRLTATVLLERDHELLVAADLPFLERLLRESRTWALVDVIAVHIVGPLVERHPALVRTLERWARDPDFWLRRSALLAHLIELRRGAGDFDRFARYADAMLEEKEFFIRKAIGWILRETGKKRPELVRAWIEPRMERASAVTKREALKSLATSGRSSASPARRRGARPARSPRPPAPR